MKTKRLFGGLSESRGKAEIPWRFHQLNPPQQTQQKDFQIKYVCVCVFIMRRGNKNQWSRRGERLRLASFLFAYWCSERDLYQQLFANSFHTGLQLGTFHSPGIFHNAHCWFVLFFCPECCFLEVLQPLICSPFFLPCKPKITSAKQKKKKTTQLDQTSSALGIHVTGTMMKVAAAKNGWALSGADRHRSIPQSRVK